MFQPTNQPKTRSAFAPMKPSNPVPAREPAPPQGPLKPPGASPEAASPPAATAMYEVPLTLRIVAELPRSEPLMIRSTLSPAGERGILIQMASSDLLVGRSLKKCDTTLVKFFVSAVLCEYMNFHRLRQDIQTLRTAVLKIAGLPAAHYWGLGLAGRLANSPFLNGLSAAPIYGPSPAVDTVELARLPVKLRVNSDLPAWQPRAGEKKENVNV